MSQFGKNFINEINFSNLQNVLRTSVMYVMSSARIFVWEGWVLERILLRVSGPAKYSLQAILYQAHCKF